jgi:hypothetical protein
MLGCRKFLQLLSDLVVKVDWSEIGVGVTEEVPAGALKPCW